MAIPLVLAIAAASAAPDPIRLAGIDPASMGAAVQATAACTFLGEQTDALQAAGAGEAIAWVGGYSVHFNTAASRQ